MHTLMVISLLAATLLGAVAGPARRPPRVWHVPGDSPTIQGAIELAATRDTIEVDGGTYRESLEMLDKVVAIRAASPGSPVTIDPVRYDERGLKVEADLADTLLLQDLTFRNGRAPYKIEGGGGARLVVQHVRIERCVFADNCASPTACWPDSLMTGYGGGLSFYADSSRVELLNSLFVRNSGTGGCGASVLASSSNIRGNTFLHGKANHAGAGLSCSTQGAEIVEALISENVFARNECIDDPFSNGGNGGGVYLRGHGIKAVGNAFVENVGAFGGGISHSGASTIEVERNIFLRNEAPDEFWANSGLYSGRGAGLGVGTVGPSAAIVRYNTFVDNWSTVLYGATLGGTIAHPGAILEGNIIVGSGGGPAAVTSYEAPIGWNLFWDNEGGEYYGWSLRQTDILADPLFVSREKGNLHLSWPSPAINAGNPELLDPDSTRADIGALYFTKFPWIVVEPVEVPPPTPVAGEIELEVSVTISSRVSQSRPNRPVPIRFTWLPDEPAIEVLAVRLLDPREAEKRRFRQKLRLPPGTTAGVHRILIEGAGAMPRILVLVVDDAGIVRLRGVIRAEVSMTEELAPGA